MLSGEAERLSGGRHIPAAPLASFSVSREARPKAASGFTWEQISVTAPAGSAAKELLLFSRKATASSWGRGEKPVKLVVGCPNRGGRMAPESQAGDASSPHPLH